MPLQDWIIVETTTVTPPPPPPATPRTFAMAAEAVPAGFTERVRRYSSIGELDDDGWTGAETAYQAIAKLFSQTPTVSAVSSVVMIRRDAEVAEQWTVDILSTPGTGDYKLFDGALEIATFTAAADPDTVIRDGLIASMIAGYTGAIVDTDTLTVTSDTTGVPFILTQTSPNGDTELDVGAGPTTPAVGIYGDLDAAYTIAPFWGILAPAATDTTNDEARRWVQADTTTRRSFFFGESTDPNIWDPGNTDNLAVDWLTAKYTRVNLKSHPVSTDYSQAADVGRLGGAFPGARAWHYFATSGTTTSDDISPRPTNATATLFTRRVSYTERLFGPTSDLITLGGFTPMTGEYIYHRWAEDWWWYTIREATDAAMKAAGGVNLDQAGLAGVIAILSVAMDPLVTNGVIAPNFTFVHTPLADVPAGELAIGDFATSGALIATAVITPKLRKLRVSAVFNLAPPT